MKIIVRIFEFQFINLLNDSQSWWLHTDYVTKVIECLQKNKLWKGFRYYLHLERGDECQFDSVEEFLELSKSWESVQTYILEREENSTDYMLHWLLNFAELENESSKSLGLALRIEEKYLQNDEIKLEQLIDFICDLYSTFEDVALFGPIVNIGVEGIFYPRVLPPRRLTSDFAPCLVNFFSKRFLQQFSEWDDNRKEKLLCLPMPPGCSRIERGDLVILRWVDNLDDKEHIAQRLGLQDQWFVEIVEPELDTNYNELGDYRLTVPPVIPDNYVTFYAPMGEIGYQATVLDDNYQLEVEMMSQLQQWLASGALPDGKPLDYITLILPSRNAALLARSQVATIDNIGACYVDNDGKLWRPYPYADLPHLGEPETATAAQSTYWFQPPLSSSKSEYPRNIETEEDYQRRMAQIEADERAFALEILDYFRQEQPEWEVDLTPPWDINDLGGVLDVNNYGITRWQESQEQTLLMYIYPSSYEFIFYSYDAFVPNIITDFSDSRVLRLMEFTSRVNAGIPFGNFQMVYLMIEEDRYWNLDYKSSIACSGGQITRALVKNLVEDNISALEKSLPAVQAVIADEISPTMAADMVLHLLEQKPQPQVSAAQEAESRRQWLQRIRSECAEEVLTEDWDLQIIEGATGAMLSMNYAGENGQFICELVVQSLGQEFLCYSIYPSPVPPSLCLAVAELIVRLDSRRRPSVGNFELNWDSGLLRYKTSIDFHGGELNPTFCGRAAYLSTFTLNEYLPMFQAVIEGGISPEDAIEQVFADDEEEEDYDNDFEWSEDEEGEEDGN